LIASLTVEILSPDPMARINTALSPVDLSRLIDGLEGTSHLDVDPIDQDRTDQLLCRLVNLFDQAMAEELQPFEVIS
tara:strand:+ start:127 stop:357 length:231 start_codon:yes stop_codon:yes gene_type:complete